MARIALLLLLCVAALAHNSVPSFLQRMDEEGEFMHMEYVNEFKAQMVNLHNKPLDGFTISVTPERVLDLTAQVNVTWSGMVKPNINDVIALYCPYTGDFLDILDHMYANETGDEFWQGEGLLTFPLCAMRCNYTFVYIYNMSRVIGVSNSVEFPEAMPTYGHLALTENIDEMLVQWVSNSVTGPTVQFGSAPGEYTTSVNGSSVTYAASDMCGAIANITASVYFRSPGYLHTVLLQGLVPGNRYYYIFGDGDYWSDEFTFAAAPQAGQDYSTTFITYGDMGVTVGLGYQMGATPTADLVAAAVQAGGVDLIFHIGDISYARGRAYIWDQFGAITMPYSTLVPYMVGVGNHEYDHISGGHNDPSGAPGVGFHPWWGNFGDDSYGECGVPTYHRYQMPAGELSNAVFWYSYTYGNIQFIMMSTEHNFTAGSPQYAWLEATLAAVDRSVTPWVVLGGHRPMYFTEFQPPQQMVALGMQAAFEDLLYKYGVNLALWGHLHEVEVTCPVYKRQCDPLGTVHAVVGSAGYNVDEAGWIKEPWNLYRSEQWGYSRVTAVNSTSMLFEWIATESNEVRYSTYLYNHHAPAQ